MNNLIPAEKTIVEELLRVQARSLADLTTATYGAVESIVSKASRMSIAGRCVFIRRCQFPQEYITLLFTEKEYQFSHDVREVVDLYMHSELPVRNLVDIAIHFKLRKSFLWWLQQVDKLTAVEDVDALRHIYINVRDISLNDHDRNCLGDLLQKKCPKLVEIYFDEFDEETTPESIQEAFNKANQSEETRNLTENEEKEMCNKHPLAGTECLFRKIEFIRRALSEAGIELPSIEGDTPETLGKALQQFYKHLQELVADQVNDAPEGGIFGIHGDDPLSTARKVKAAAEAKAGHGFIRKDLFSLRGKLGLRGIVADFDGDVEHGRQPDDISLPFTTLMEILQGNVELTEQGLRRSLRGDELPCNRKDITVKFEDHPHGCVSKVFERWAKEVASSGENVRTRGEIVGNTDSNERYSLPFGAPQPGSVAEPLTRIQIKNVLSNLYIARGRILDDLGEDAKPKRKKLATQAIDGVIKIYEGMSKKAKDELNSMGGYKQMLDESPMAEAENRNRFFVMEPGIGKTQDGERNPTMAELIEALRNGDYARNKETSRIKQSIDHIDTQLKLIDTAREKINGFTSEIDRKHQRAIEKANKRLNQLWVKEIELMSERELLTRRGDNI